MDALHLVLNAVTVIFIGATMFAAGLRATVPALRSVFADIPLLLLALIANMVVIPLLGWGLGALLGLSSASFIALILIASSPGGLFGAKLATVQQGDVGALVRTVAPLQLVPFAIGLLLRRYAESTGRSWHPTAAAVSNITFLVVLAAMRLGNWRDVVDLFGSLALLAGFLLAVFAGVRRRALRARPRSSPGAWRGWS
ncbi:hypothetical protein ACFYZB_38435 [Streptomyces sp. NPDC001852]|uniref:hypothetical protein n=1 Tax=Streptomyces sp. NPDC001852 TaxID=3364619 RepID=UPI0036816DC6